MQESSDKGTSFKVGSTTKAVLDNFGGSPGRKCKHYQKGGSVNTDHVNPQK